MCVRVRALVCAIVWLSVRHVAECASIVLQKTKLMISEQQIVVCIAF